MLCKSRSYYQLYHFTGFGKFNYLLIATLLPAACGQLFGTGTMSYVLPSAECDLELTNVHKGALNACTYAGK